MPALSPTMEKGNLARWLKKEGDKIKPGDVIAEIETDKATMEVEAVDEGTLAKIVVAPGTADVPVNQLIGIIAADGEDVAAAAASGAGGAAPAPAPAAAPAAAPAPAASAPAPAPASAPQAAAAPAASGSRVFASPLAKRLAKEAGIDVSRISGTGPHGRVVERDVKAAMAGGALKAAPAAAAPASAPMASSMGDEQIKKFFQPGTYEEIPHDSMRKTIARRLVEAKQTIPHFYLTVDCELDKLMALREDINKGAPDVDGMPAYKVSVNDFVIKALAMALKKVPDANVTWTEGAMLKHKSVDLGLLCRFPAV